MYSVIVYFMKTSKVQNITCFLTGPCWTYSMSNVCMTTTQGRHALNLTCTWHAYDGEHLIRIPLSFFWKMAPVALWMLQVKCFTMIDIMCNLTSETRDRGEWIYFCFLIFFVFVFMSRDSSLSNQEFILTCLLYFSLIIKLYHYYGSII